MHACDLFATGYVCPTLIYVLSSIIYCIIRYLGGNNGAQCPNIIILWRRHRIIDNSSVCDLARPSHTEGHLAFSTR